ncbi:MAG TPA: HypC/HybG/HupF family hydrogenase formation chaperone [Vicinamibacterales bacterium]|nr:HypC/HybG/HupF family hydrogenase formation chaperone [Vicinamibacterales bacterium]
MCLAIPGQIVELVAGGHLAAVEVSRVRRTINVDLPGQLVAIVAAESADRGLEALHRVAGGESAAIVGRVEVAPARTVVVVAPYGGTRVVDMLVGDPLPRIC